MKKFHIPIKIDIVYLTRSGRNPIPENDEKCTATAATTVLNISSSTHLINCTPMTPFDLNVHDRLIRKLNIKPVSIPTPVKTISVVTEKALLNRVNENRSSLPKTNFNNEKSPLSMTHASTPVITYLATDFPVFRVFALSFSAKTDTSFYVILPKVGTICKRNIANGVFKW